MEKKVAKGHLAKCPAKDVICISCNFKRHSTKNCKSRRRNVSIVNIPGILNTGIANPSDNNPVVNNHVEKECCGVINAWLETGKSDNDDYSVLNVTTIFGNDGKELKKPLNVGLGMENFVKLNI